MQAKLCSPVEDGARPGAAVLLNVLVDQHIGQPLKDNNQVIDLGVGHVPDAIAKNFPRLQNFLCLRHVVIGSTVRERSLILNTSLPNTHPAGFWLAL